MEKTHIIKDEKEEIFFCGIRGYHIPLGSLDGRELTENYIKKFMIKDIICKSCLRNWRKLKEVRNSSQA